MSEDWSQYEVNPKDDWSQYETKGPSNNEGYKPNLDKISQIPTELLKGLKTSHDLLSILADRAVAGKPLREGLEQYFGANRAEPDKAYVPGDPTAEKLASSPIGQTAVKTAMDIGLDPVTIGSFGASGLVPKTNSISSLVGNVKPISEVLSDRAALSAVKQALKSGYSADDVARINALGKDKLIEFGKKLIDSGASGFSKSASRLQEAGQGALKSGGKKIGDVISSIDQTGPTFSTEEAAQAVENKLGKFYRDPLNRSKTKAYEDIIQGIKARGGTTLNPQEQEILSGLQEIVDSGGRLKPAEEGIIQSFSNIPPENIPLSKAQELQKDVGRIGFPGGKRPLVPSPQQEVAQQARNILKDQITQQANQNLGPEGVDLLNQGRSEYELGKNIGRQKGVAKQALTEQLPGEPLNFNYKDLLNLPVKAATAVPNLAIKAAQNPEILSKASQGVDILTKALNNPKTVQFLGKFASPLIQASQRGTTALNASSFVMSQQDPDYREKLRQLTGAEEP